MILRYFGFSREPFGSSPDPSSLYAGATHREALASLKYGFTCARGFTALIAPPGMGKTTLLFRFLEDIRASSRSAFLFDLDNQCEPREILACILRDIGITPASGFAEMHEQLNGFLLAEARAGRKFVLVIDEAQNLSDAALERVRLLSNFETPRTKLMQIILAGQPQLAHKLMQPSLVQLRQRISTICRLQPLSREDTHAYIRHRLDTARYRGEPLFTKEALDLIAEASQGIPRTINNLCFNALSLCCALRRKQVDGSMAAEVLSDQQLTPDSGMSLVSAHMAVGASEHGPSEHGPRAAAVTETLLKEEPRMAVVTLAPGPRRQRAGLAWLWLPAISVLSIIVAFTVFKLPRLRDTRSHNTVDLHWPDRSSPLSQAPVPMPAMATNVPPPVAGPALKTASIAIKVEPHQTLTSIALKYLGSSDVQLMQQIKTLNPNLIDPDHISAGQTIWLPGPTPQEEIAATPANARNIP